MDTAEVDQSTQMRAMREILITIGEIPPTVSPSEIANISNRVIREVTGIDDLFYQVKQESTRLALSIYPDLVDLASGDADSLEQAMKISASGNVIDVVHNDDYNLWDEVIRTVSQPLLGNGLEVFRKRLAEADHLLYLGDNTGETVFDRVLIETLEIPVIYAVKGGAILNDATHSDAVDAGLDQLVTIVETGSRGPGTILSECSPEFKQLFNQSNFILAKGQANYETLDREGDRVFFLLRIKCPVVSREIGYPVGNLVFEQGKQNA
jgi:uncharacterized protein with ATP-grasp and redox domains